MSASIPIRRKVLRTFALLVFTSVLALPVSAQQPGHGPRGHHGPGGGMGHHGADGTGHDEVNMPGLRGLDATPEESAELATMFRNYPKISREVTNLPNGIRTITFSEDEEIMAVLAAM